MTDGRFSSLHMTNNALLSLDFPEAEPGFGSIPAFDDDVPVPPERDPPKPDEDETLPSKAHPSYPYGRPYARDGGQSSSLSLAHNLFALSAQSLGRSSGSSSWGELGLRDLLPLEAGREVPPGMAGAKRGPEDDRSASDDGASEGGTVREDDAGTLAGDSSRLGEGEDMDSLDESDEDGLEEDEGELPAGSDDEEDERSRTTSEGAEEMYDS